MARCLQEINLGSDVCWILARCWQQSGWIMVEILVPTFYQYWTNAVPVCESTNGPIQSTNIWPLFKPIFGQYWTYVCVLAGLLWFFCCDRFLNEQEACLCAGHGFFQWYQLSLSDFRLVVLCPGFCLQQVRSLITNLYIRHNWIYSQTQAAMDIYQTILCRHKPLWIYTRPFGADTSRYGYIPDHLVQT